MKNIDTHTSIYIYILQIRSSKCLWIGLNSMVNSIWLFHWNMNLQCSSRNMSLQFSSILIIIFPNLFCRFVLSNYVAIFRTLLPYEQVNLDAVTGIYLNRTMLAYLLFFYLNAFVHKFLGFTTTNLFTSYDFTSYQCWGN